MQQVARADLTRIFLVILIIAVLIAGSLWTLLPFLGALIWAATIVIATWPLLIKAQNWAGGRRSVATAFLTIVMLAIFIVQWPVYGMIPVQIIIVMIGIGLAFRERRQPTALRTAQRQVPEPVGVGA